MRNLGVQGLYISSSVFGPSSNLSDAELDDNSKKIWTPHGEPLSGLQIFLVNQERNQNQTRNRSISRKT